jgi:hypothetical protein
MYHIKLGGLLEKTQQTSGESGDFSAKLQEMWGNHHLAF